jgi:hypothetical protein
VCSTAWSTLYADAPDDDHLVPVRAFFQETKGIGGAYRKLWQEKLLVTSGDVARYVSLPAYVDPERVVSVYKARGKKSLGLRYWVTVTEPSRALWECVASGDEKLTGRIPIDPASVSVQRCDAPLPESTAMTIRKLWLKMLRDVRGQSSDAMSLDGSTEIFSATSQDGTALQGQIPIEPKEHTAALLDLANQLADYCHAESAKRPEQSRKIEAESLMLLNQISNR